MTTGAAAGQINLTELMDNSRVGSLQIRVFALCLASLIMDGFDVQAMGYVATDDVRGVERAGDPRSAGCLSPRQLSAC